MPDVVKCPDCGSRLASAQPGRVKHNPDGSHTFEPIRPPRRVDDVKLRGKRRG